MLTLVSRHPFLCASSSLLWERARDSRWVTHSRSCSHRQHGAISGIKNIIAYGGASHSAKSVILSLAGYLQIALKF